MRRDSAPWAVSFIFALAWGVTASAQGQVDITQGMSGYQGQNGRILVVNGIGGNIEQHNAMWRDHARRGGSVRIAGVCRSAARWSLARSSAVASASLRVLVSDFTWTRPARHRG